MAAQNVLTVTLFPRRQPQQQQWWKFNANANAKKKIKFVEYAVHWQFCEYNALNPTTRKKRTSHIDRKLCYKLHFFCGPTSIKCQHCSTIIPQQYERFSTKFSIALTVLFSNGILFLFHSICWHFTFYMQLCAFEQKIKYMRTRSNILCS